MDDELKYLKHFGLHFNPFPVAPDVENFFLSPNIDHLITEIIHGIRTRKGFMVLTGEVGLGKTTISRKIIAILARKGIKTSLVFHTSYQDVELLREINRDFGLEGGSLRFGDQMRILNDFLLAQNRMGKNCAIIIDDAQNLNHESLELVRMISNLETNQQKLVQILLIGQPELVVKLNSPDLRQLKSRIIIRVEARPMDIEELYSYLLFKLSAAGNRGKTTIKKNAIQKIHHLCKGNFRRVNVLMDRCLFVAFLNDSTEISKATVKEAYHDLTPDRFRLRKRPLIWATSVLFITSLVGGLGYLGFCLDLRFTQWGDILKYPASPGIAESSMRDLHSADGQSGDPEGSAAFYRARISKIPQPVADFLREYQLSDYDNSFFEALKTSRFQEFSDCTFDQTGLRLILLEHVPDTVRAKYSILAYPIDSKGKQGFFLFWRPTLQVENFYYGYEGEEISVLQDMLAAVNLYDDQLDGVVGRNLMTSVIRFQQEMALPVTGLPDDRTLFLLCDQQGSISGY
jgi:general secretion pathway protein A